VQNEAVGLFHELKRQAVEAPRFEAQITMAAQRVIELEAQVQELQEENQSLASLQPSVLHGTGLDVTSTGMDTPVSMPDVARHSNFRPSPHKAVYADDAAMTISAMEQQLALAESQATEALTSLEQLMEDNVRLRKEVQQLTQELEQRGVSTNFNNQVRRVMALW
jgi:regulator of replication initiation timing